MIRKILRRIQKIVKKMFVHEKISILDQYIMSNPNNQDTVDIFKNEWSSKFPDESHINAGKVELFNDERIIWALRLFGDITDTDILELGPLEAGHTYMLHNNRVRSILSIEANTRAFLKMSYR